MARDWNDLFISDAIAPAAGGGDGAAQAPERKRRFFSRLRSNLSKTREALTSEIQATLFDTLDDETRQRRLAAVERLHTALYSS